MALWIAVLLPLFRTEPAHGQPTKVKVEVAQVVVPIPNLVAPNFFALTIDPKGFIYVGGAVSGNVLRVAPKVMNPDPKSKDIPCVTEILSPERAKDKGIDFGGPKGIAIGSDGTVYVAGTGGSPNLNDNIVSVAPDGTIKELVRREQLGRNDWNPGGLAIEETDAGTFVYATGPAPGPGAVVRVAPDGTFQQLMKIGGQGLVVDETGNVYWAQVGDNTVYEIPNARVGVCNDMDINGKVCPHFVENGELGCDGKAIDLRGPYGLALAGGILYIATQNSQRVFRRPLRPDNTLGLPLCTQQIFANGDGGLTLETPRPIAADSAGNVYAIGNRSDNVIWIRPDPSDNTEVIPQEIIGRNAPLASPQAGAVDSQGNFYVSGLFTDNVFRIRTVMAGESCGNGKRDDGEVCDYALDCCCSLTCDIPDAGAVCRGAAGDCDSIDICDGATRDCADERQGSDVVCRPAKGLCDVLERCDGGIDCPKDVFQSAGTECREVTDKCDAAESCTGTGPDCPPDAVVRRDTVCRDSVSSCDPPERCDGLSGVCPEDVVNGPPAACSLNPDAFKGRDPACVEDVGQCDGNHECQLVVRTGSPCVPTGMDQPDLSCLASATCDASGACEVVVKPDGDQCGNFCENTQCMDGKCVPKPRPHPCGGSDLEHCNPTMLGHECTQCGDGVVEPPESCDDGNQIGNDGCTERCELACDPASTQPCASPLLDEKVPDPCRQNQCLPVDLNPRIEDEGFACVTVGLGCTGCLSDLECSPSDSCHVARCDQNMCVNEDKMGFDRAICGFSDAFPGAGSACEESGGKNKARTLAGIEKLEANARKLVEGTTCSAGAAKPKAKVMRRVRHLLRLAVFRANALRSPFREKITQDCENMLTVRFDRLLDNLEAAQTLGWSCGGG